MQLVCRYVAERVEKRAAEWAMIPSANQEQLHVLRYTVGQQYADHWVRMLALFTTLFCVKTRFN
jgi:hypothetical protein